jgi:hypothetical protein
VRRKNVGGRPPLPRDEVRSKRIVAFLRAADLRMLERIAAERCVPVGQAAREILERALRRRGL